MRPHIPQRSAPKGRPPMIVNRGLRNDDLELRERTAVQAIIDGNATPSNFTTVADMHSGLILAGSQGGKKQYIFDYAHGTVGPVLRKIAERYTRTHVISATTKEKQVLREFVTKHREFWMRQSAGLYEAVCRSLQSHYDAMNKGKEAA